MELMQLRLGVERQRPHLVEFARDGWQFAAALFEEGALDAVVPLDGIQNADGPLRLHEPIAQGANHTFIRCECPRRSAVGTGYQSTHGSRLSAKSGLLAAMHALRRSEEHTSELQSLRHLV